MRWLNSKALGGHRFFLLKRILLFSVMLCFLVVFNLSFADELTDPDDPDWEHPWDDLCNTGSQNPDDPSDTDNVLIFQFGFDFWIIIYPQAPGQKNGFEEEKAFGPTEKNRGHLLIFVK
jgi:hypothetical protein